MNKRAAIMIEEILRLENVEPSDALTKKILDAVDCFSESSAVIVKMRHGLYPYTKKHTRREVVEHLRVAYDDSDDFFNPVWTASLIQRREKDVIRKIASRFGRQRDGLDVVIEELRMLLK